MKKNKIIIILLLILFLINIKNNKIIENYDEKYNNSVTMDFCAGRCKETLDCAGIAFNNNICYFSKSQLLPINTESENIESEIHMEPNIIKNNSLCSGINETPILKECNNSEEESTKKCSDKQKYLSEYSTSDILCNKMANIVSLKKYKSHIIDINDNHDPLTVGDRLMNSTYICLENNQKDAKYYIHDKDKLNKKKI